jgi:hypothetical protein
MNKNSVLPAKWTMTVLFEFIARFVGLRAHNLSFSTPLPMLSGSAISMEAEKTHPFDKVDVPSPFSPFIGQLFTRKTLFSMKQLLFLFVALPISLISLTEVLAQAPPNDLYANATRIACGETVNGSTVGAGRDGPGTDCGFSDAGLDVWYTIVGTGENITASLCGSDFDTKIDVLPSCISLTLSSSVTTTSAAYNRKRLGARYLV